MLWPMCTGQNPANGSTTADRAAVGVHFVWEWAAAEGKGKGWGSGKFRYLERGGR